MGPLQASGGWDFEFHNSPNLIPSACKSDRGPERTSPSAESVVVATQGFSSLVHLWALRPPLSIPPKSQLRHAFKDRCEEALAYSSNL
eukprot:4371851-Pyramimonas_sp.AAC.1